MTFDWSFAELLRKFIPLRQVTGNLLGQRLCRHCGVETIGTTDIGTLTIGLELRDVIADEGELFRLSCGHVLHKLMPMFSNKEWHRGSEDRWGERNRIYEDNGLVDGLS